MQANVTSLLGAIETMGRTRREMTELSKSENDIKLQKLTESDDIEAFLTTFERMMLAYEIRRERWAYKLAPNLTGKAQQAYAAMPTEEAGNYEALKVAILRRYDINQETYRQRFRQTSRKDSETYRDLAVRLMDLLKKWMKDHMESVQAVLEQVAIKQLSNKLPPEVHVWVQDRRPKTVLKAGELADEYTLVRKQVKNDNQKPPGEPVITATIARRKATWLRSAGRQQQIEHGKVEGEKPS